MSYIRKTNKVLLYLILSATLFLTYAPNHTSAQKVAGDVRSSSTVSAFIGDAEFTVYGYTSPGARVIIEGQGIFDQTYADSKGYFTLHNRFSPTSAKEACITAFDNAGGSSQPLCLPPFPNKKQVTIGPIVLPPIIAVSQNQFSVKDNGFIIGKTVPNSNVSLSFFGSSLEDKSTTGISLPEIQTEADGSGTFTVTVPTDQEQQLRFFATSNYLDIPSIKSNTLTIDILPLWKLILKQFTALFDFFNKHLLDVILASEAMIVLFFFFVYYRRRHEAHPLALRPEHSLNAIENKPSDHL